MGLSLHFVESDCLAIINVFSKCSSFFDELGSLSEDLASLMSNFLGISLIHVRRTANGTAHGLTRHALRVDRELVWFDEIHFFIGVS
uniref:RNase H type-1 domain-containing protein n=1 Tax=Cannabis sativa TaxID=3483 RepID=A0A803NWX2_CANSA